MENKNIALMLIIVMIAGFTACNSGPKVINDMSGASYQLINQDGERVNFTRDIKGHYTLLSFVYTHCPFMCHLITANMATIQRELGPNSKVQFVEISFDPRRDNPARLRKYTQRYKLNMRNFTMLTGDSLIVDSVMKAANVKYWVQRPDSVSDTTQYYFKHTNRIDILDKKGRVRRRYPGSKVPPENVIEDLRKLQSK